MALAEVEDISSDSIYYSEAYFYDNQYIIAQQSPEEAFEYFSRGAEYFMSKNDTINYLYCIVNLSDIEMRKGQFNKSFDLLLENLSKSEKLKNKVPSYRIHQMLGILYGIYGKDSIALSHTKDGLDIAREYSKNNDDNPFSLVSSYLDVAVQYSKMKDYDSALVYLDSCYIVNPKKDERLYFVDGVYGYVYLKKGYYEKSKQYLKGVIPFLKKNGDGFQCDVYYYLAELKLKEQSLDSAIYFYKKSLESIDSLQSNLKLKPKVLKRLSDVYNQKRDYKLAYRYIAESKVISDSLFTAQSYQNKRLFEVKNRYKENLVKTETELEAQNKLLKLGKESRFRLRLLIIVIIVFSCVGIWLLLQRSRMKQKVYQQRLTREKNESLINFKNKELTANTLQLIGKDQMIKELLDALREESSSKYKVFNSRFKQDNKKIWDNFQSRFTETNDEFNNRLLQKYPELTPVDLRHCALIRLGFDSKEMSKLLGISINSVHMARSRIRKKMGLSRDESLSNCLSLI